jgi:EamA domain-containing membrane protein RarD
MNNAMNIIVSIITGVLQDRSPASNPYLKVTPVYVVLSVLSLVVSLVLVSLFLFSKTSSKFRSLEVDIGRLQWTRKRRLRNGEAINERRQVVDDGVKMRKTSKVCFCVLVLLVLGSWVAYFWGVATGNND